MSETTNSIVARLILYALWLATIAVSAIAACSLPHIVNTIISSFVIYHIVTSIILWALRIRNAGKA
jgi:hypothetical protein